MRNFNDWFLLKPVLVAISIVAIIGIGQTFAQNSRISLGRKNNSSRFSGPNGGQPNGAQSVNPQPSVSSQFNPQQAPLVQAPSIDSAGAAQFMERLDRAIEITSKRHLIANSHSPWQIFHSILALRQDCLVRLGNEKVNAIQWLSTAEPQFDGEPWMLLTSHGAKFHPYTKKYFFEGHPGQFLALLSQSNLPLDHQFRVQGKTVTLNDVVINTMKEVNTQEEVTWVLWALQHFLKPDAAWVNQHNEQWSIERLVQMETAANVVGTPCGGNHRLFALTRARDKYLQTSGQQLRGVWLAAHQKILKHIEIAKSLQNRDGSFSSQSYEGPGYTTDVNIRFNTTGHTMEFLSIALPKERLNEQWVRNAVWILSNELIYHQNTQIDGGPLFHTLDALILYRDRIRPAAPVESGPPPQIANPAPDKTLGMTPNSNRSSTNIAETNKPTTKWNAIANKNAEPKISNSGNQAVPLPDLETDPAPSKIDSKPVREKVADPKLPASDLLSRAGSAKKPMQKLDPWRPKNANSKVGEPKAKSAQDSLSIPNAGDAPALLPETFAKPLTKEELDPSDFSSPPESVESGSKASSAVETTVEELPVEIGLPSLPDVGPDEILEPESALEPANG